MYPLQCIDLLLFCSVESQFAGPRLSAHSLKFIAVALQVFAHRLAINPEPAPNLADRKAIGSQFVNHQIFPLCYHRYAPSGSSEKSKL